MEMELSAQVDGLHPVPFTLFAEEVAMIAELKITRQQTIAQFNFDMVRSVRF